MWHRWWNIVQSLKGGEFQHILQHGWTLGMMCYKRRVSHKKQVLLDLTCMSLKWSNSVVKVEWWLSESGAGRWYGEWRVVIWWVHSFNLLKIFILFILMLCVLVVSWDLLLWRWLFTLGKCRLGLAAPWRWTLSSWTRDQTPHPRI